MIKKYYYKLFKKLNYQLWNYREIIPLNGIASLMLLSPEKINYILNFINIYLLNKDVIKNKENYYYYLIN